MHKGAQAGRVRRLGTLLGAASLVLGTMTASVAVGTMSANATTPFKACVVTDTGGINDKSFNYSAYKGLLDAAAVNTNIQPSYLSSTSGTDYAPNIQTFISQGCGIIVTVGFLMDTATANAAVANPNQKFAIVDDEPTNPTTHAALPNVLGLLYDTNQGAFLGGYLAAATSKTGVVATYGGINIVPVTIYMNGFVAGVRYYNKTMGKHVKVLGWKPAAGNCSLTKCNGKGTFTGNFTDLHAGQQITSSDFAAHADVVFPVAGSVGLGSIAAAKQAGKGHSVLWVDSNGCTTDAKDCKWLIGTVAKGVEASVKAAVLSAANGTFAGGTYTGTLKNNGTSLEYGGIKVPASIKAKIKSIQKGIVSGKISVNPNKYPAH
ncbi:MAG TPA: BMP family ABC transporter substrate-binding protein [Acidimicrobiales bacterium]|nr:BMP family ABC transporter substrate-binding protein [Acidimicrobiales bacterium]